MRLTPFMGFTFPPAAARVQAVRGVTGIVTGRRAGTGGSGGGTGAATWAAGLRTGGASG